MLLMFRHATVLPTVSVYYRCTQHPYTKDLKEDIMRRHAVCHVHCDAILL